ncbi:MAG TPA: GNAT family N-acetyltransferase [Methylomirabilota bacterium]|nr:GNAT family N-acetyltransferase [Methylomirabilota bacterium]
MSRIVIRRARREDCDAIADMVRRLAADTRQSTIPKATGDDLRAEAFQPDPIVSLLVADDAGRVVGALVGATTYSTWRAGRGLYVVDLFVEPGYRGARLGERLIIAAARVSREAGGVFVKLEVVAGNDHAKRFYRRLGFAPVAGDETFVLEGPAFSRIGAD